MLGHVLHTTKDRFKQNTGAVLTFKKQRYKFTIVEVARVTGIDSRIERKSCPDRQKLHLGLLASQTL